MAPSPGTTIRTIRIEPDLWRAAKTRADEEETNVSELIRGWLTDYAAGKRRFGPGRPNTVEVSRQELRRLRDLIDSILL